MPVVTGRPVHVICLNDFPVAAVLGTKQQADAKRLELRAEHRGREAVSEAEYANRARFWHIKTVELFDLQD